MIVNAVHTLSRRQYALSMRLRTVSHVNTSYLKQISLQKDDSDRDRNGLLNDSNIQYRMLSYGSCIGRPPHSVSFLQDSMNPMDIRVSSKSSMVGHSFIQRDLSSRGRSGNHYNRKNRSDEPLKNDILISQLIKRKRQDAESIQVRLIINKGQGQKSEIEVMSLMKAIEKSSELAVDLVEIDLQQDIPVITAVDFKKLLYAKQKSSSGTGASSSNSPKATKEFKFKVSFHFFKNDGTLFTCKIPPSQKINLFHNFFFNY